MHCPQGSIHSLTHWNIETIEHHIQIWEAPTTWSICLLQELGEQSCLPKHTPDVTPWQVPGQNHDAPKQRCLDSHMASLNKDNTERANGTQGFWKSKRESFCLRGERKQHGRGSGEVGEKREGEGRVGQKPYPHRSIRRQNLKKNENQNKEPCMDRGRSFRQQMSSLSTEPVTNCRLGWWNTVLKSQRCE